MYRRIGAASFCVLALAVVLGVRGPLTNLRAQNALAATNALANPAAPVSALDAQSAFAQGEELERAHQYAQAAASFSEAIKLQPNWAEAYLRRGMAKERQNNIFGALEDFKKAVTLNPQDARAHERRARMYEVSGDFTKSAADLDQAIQLEPAWTALYFRRGISRMILGQWDGAATDLQTFCDRAPQAGDANYARLYLWYVAHEQGKGADADKALATFFEGAFVPPGMWTASVAEFLLGHMSQDELLNAAKSSDPRWDRHLRCEAWFYIGLKALVAGDKKSAAPAFQSCVATGMFRLAESEFASARLKEWSTAP